MYKIKNGKISFALFMVYILTLTALPSAFAAEAGDCPKQELMYLVDDVFATKNCKDNSGKTIISSWDLRDSGGIFEGNYYSSFKITDNNNRLPVEMNRKFDAVDSGDLTSVFTFKFLTKMNGVSFSMGENIIDAMRIFTKDDNLCLLQPDGSYIVLTHIKLNYDYGIKAFFCLNEKTISIYLNGELVADRLPFANDVSCINNFDINTGNETIGEMFFDTVKIYKGYKINERFIETINHFPSDWANISNGGAASVIKLESRMPPDLYSLKLDGLYGDAGISKTIDPVTKHIVFEAKMILPKYISGAGISLSNDDRKILSVVSTGASFSYQSGNGEMVPFYDYTPNVWYQVKLDVDLPNSAAKVYLNGKLKAENIPLDETLKQVNMVKAFTAQGDENIAMMDDFLLYPFQEEPENYVTAPIKAESANQLVGMQVCSLWRESDHRGWDWINPWPERRPYLGYYDEGSAEVADWEIKYMVEHGVDFEMYCWYRSLAFEEGPIKDSSLNPALHEGYFNAKYSNQLDFMILWENASYSIDTASDFENNLVPYWMEYYFKDDRYLKVNGRPIFGIYYYDRLKTAFGGAEGVKKELQFLSDKCIEAGLGDPYIFISYGGNDPVKMQEMKDAGIDAAYNYTWGYSASNIAIQEINTQKQADQKKMDIIPSMSMGRDDTAWGLMPGGWTTTETYTQLLSWAKDTFLSANHNKSLGQDMVMLTTWNEYGEGHFISPAGLNGFGYLDAIKNVFAGESDHEDIIPTQAQKDRFNHLYMKDRVITLARQKSAIPNGVKQGWYFDTNGDSEGWMNLQNIRDFKASGGVLSGTVTSNDSSIISKNDLNLDISDVTYIKLRMKNSSESQYGEMFFTTNEDPKWDEAKKLEFTTNPQDPGYSDYYLPMWSRGNWTGTLKQFRIDPLTSQTGSFEIDSIEMLHDATQVEGVKLMVDSNVLACEPAPISINNRTLVPVRKVAEALGAKLDWDTRSDTVSIMKNQSFLQLKVGQNTAYKNDQPIKLDQGAVIQEGRTFVPIRFIAEAMNVDVDWDEDAQIVYINTPEGLAKKNSSNSAAPVMKRELLYNTEFNTNGDFESWLSNEFISGATVDGGKFSGMSLGNDPMIISSDIGVTAKDVKNLSIGFQNGTSDDIGRMYFITDQDSTWDENKSILFNLKINDTGITQYNFDPNQNPNWKGKIMRMRFDLSALTGKWVIDYIRLEGDFKPVEIETSEDKPASSDITETERRLSWEFETNSGTDGWLLNRHMGNIKLDNGKLSAAYVGPQPNMQTIADIEKKAAEIKNISIKYKNQSESSKAKLYFITDEDPLWSSDKSFEFESIEGDTVGEKYIIDTSVNPLWKGTLKGLKFEPAYSGGGFTIDYIRLEKQAAEGEKKGE